MIGRGLLGLWNPEIKAVVVLFGVQSALRKMRWPI
jgi:hypothetical protein